MTRLSRSCGRWLTACCLLSLASGLNAAQMDPLTAAELTAAANLIAPASAPKAFASRSLLPSTSTASTSPPATTLLIERRHISKQDQASRLADVYVYHYDTNELERSIVDLNTRTVVESSRSQGTQLPLVEEEIERAAALLFDDDEQFSLINQEYQRVIGTPLTSPEQLHVKAFTFHADNLPQKVNQAAAECGVRRCAQLLIYTDTNIIFEITPIVDLSANVVIQNIGF